MLCPLSWDDDNWRSMCFWYMNDILPCSDPCHATMMTDGACFTTYRWITMLCALSWDDDNWRCMFHFWERYITIIWPLSWDDDNWGSMIHTLGIYYHALSVVIGRWQLTEYASYMSDILPCSDRCHVTVTNEWAWFIPKGYMTMLCPL